MVIRKATSDDSNAVWSLENECFEIPWSLKSIKEDLECNTFAHYYVAENGEITAYIGVHLIYEDAQITNLAVTSKARKKGVGTALINHLCRQVKDMGGKNITLEVSDKNHAAIKLYTGAGFKPVSIRKNYYSHDNSDAIIMLKVID